MKWLPLKAVCLKSDCAITFGEGVQFQGYVANAFTIGRQIQGETPCSHPHNGQGTGEDFEYMAFLIDETPEAKAWVDRYIATPSRGDRLGRLVSAVIWTDGFLENGEPLGGSDPSAMVTEINDRGWPLTHGHDPGLPAGRVIAARVFKSPNGTQFIAAILAYYELDQIKSFTALGVDPSPSVTPPESLPVCPDIRIQVGVDSGHFDRL